MRLDQALVRRNLYSTRARAVAAIKAGLVTVNGAPAKKPSQDVQDEDVLIGGAVKLVFLVVGDWFYIKKKPPVWRFSICAFAIY